MIGSSYYESLAAWSQIAGAAVFVAGLVYVFVRFVIPAVRASEEHKNAELAEAERRRDDAKVDADRARAELEAATRDVAAIGERSDRDAVRERQRLLAEAQSEGERIVRNAEGELARGRYAARALLREELIAKAVGIARNAAATADDAADRRVVGQVMDTIERREGRS
ncbi:MAG: ATP synthase F0 subunit B [Candidatus Baltobacteraceae bacterium]